MVNAQEWLDENYPKERRKETTELDIRNKDLEGDLIFNNDWFSLKKINCGENLITSLTLNNLSMLIEVWCYDNRLNNLKFINCSRNISSLNANDNFLTNLDFLDNLEAQKLSWLGISNNNFSKKDLTVFSKFINLEEIDLRANKFYGSLVSFNNLTKLKALNILNNNIEDDLEYLPENLNKFYYDGKLTKQLKDYTKKDLNGAIYYNYQIWRKNNQKLIARFKARELLKEEFQEKDQQIQELKNQLTQKESQTQALQTENNHLRSKLNKMEELITQEQTPQILHNSPKPN